MIDSTFRNKAIKLLFDRMYVELDSGCWMWTGSTLRGYGTISINRKTIKAHRAMWMVHNGEIQQGLVVCHKCDTPLCVNPDHLFVGTQRDNLIDASRKKRLWTNKVTHCPRGHAYDKENTYYYHGGRKCIACQKIFSLNYRNKITALVNHVR